MQAKGPGYGKQHGAKRQVTVMLDGDLFVEVWQLAQENKLCLAEQIRTLIVWGLEETKS